MADTKICPACGEEIKAIAKKCPHCLTWQSKWKIDQSNPKYQLFWVAVIIFFLGFSFYFKSTVADKFNTSNFNENRQLLTIKNSKMDYVVRECGGFISILGTITNNSPVAWENIYFEARFYNSNNELIDSISDNDYNLVALANSDSTFVIDGKAHKSKNEYDHYDLIIKKARESNALY